MLYRRCMYFALVLFYAGLLCLVPAPVSAASRQVSTLPSGFSESTVVTGLDSPTQFAFAPDGRIFICEKGGSLRVVKNGTLLPTPFVQVTVNADSERGLLGVAFDPGFGKGTGNDYVYIRYSFPKASAPGGVVNRISRFLANGDVAVPGSEQVLIDDISAEGGNHNAGGIHFGLDGKLYVPTGDAGNHSEYAQDLTKLNGKILRINPDGSAPTDNPFYDPANPTAPKSKIFAYGFRNPFTFAVRPGSGVLFVNDVGQNDWEEIDYIERGKNYGWRPCEGPSNQPPNTSSSSCQALRATADYRDPIFSYNHSGFPIQGNVIAGGAFISGTNWPAQYQNKYFFGDEGSNKIWYITPPNSNTVLPSNAATEFSSNLSGIVDIQNGPDGDLYYLELWTGELQHVFPTNTVPPTPCVSSPSLPYRTTAYSASVAFSAACSSVPTGQTITDYKWNFGDNTTGTGQSPSHTYTAPGHYTVTLTITSTSGLSASKNDISISIGVPAITITSPAANSKYNAGDTIMYSGNATYASTPSTTDPVPASRFVWTMIFHHDDGNPHTHPFLGPISGVVSGTFVIPQIGELSPNTWYEIQLAVSRPDKPDVVGQQSIFIYPNKVSITVTTSPPNLDVIVDGGTIRAPHVFTSVVGFKHSIATNPVQIQNAQSWCFKSWSNGGALSQIIEAPASPTTYTATFETTCLVQRLPLVFRAGTSGW